MPVVIAGLILSFLVMLLFGGTEIDRGLLILFTLAGMPRLEQVAELVGLAATPLPLLIALGAGALYLGMHAPWRYALLLLGIVLGARLVIDALQGITEGLRPEPNERLYPSQQRLYPSGHAANATVTAVAIAFLATRHYPTRAWALGLAAAFAMSVGAARLMLGASWPSDIIGGWAFGLAWTLLLLRLAGEDLGDGTARPVRHSPHKGEQDGKPQDRDRTPE